MRLGNTTGRLVFERRHCERSAEEQEESRAAAAGDVPTKPGLLLKIMTVAGVCGRLPHYLKRNRFHFMSPVLLQWASI